MNGRHHHHSSTITHRFRHHWPRRPFRKLAPALSSEEIFRFFDLPKEIRLIIYEYLLVSPTGCVSIQHWRLRGMGTSIIKPCDPHLEEPETVSYMGQPMIRNAILQTCKQAWREGKGMLLDKNAIFLCGQFDLNTFIQAYQRRFGWNRNMYKHAKHILVPVNLSDLCTSPRDPNDMFRNPKLVLTTLARALRDRRTVLKRVTLVLEDPLDGIRALLQDLREEDFSMGITRPTYLSRDIPELNSSLEWLSDFAKHNPSLEKGIIVRSGMVCMSETAQKCLVPAAMYLDPLMEELHKAFGGPKGELWLDRVLCYKDGKRVEEAFQA